MQSSPEFKQQIELARQQLLIAALVDDQARRTPISDAEAKAEYDKLKSANSGTEYRARHILVEKEDEAKSLIKQINGGAKFEDLAKKNSKDPGSGANGGDLDFATPGSYVPEFSQAMVELKKGEMTDTPVKSQFGWHIIKLEDTREAQFPPFDEVKAASSSSSSSRSWRASATSCGRRRRRTTSSRSSDCDLRTRGAAGAPCRLPASRG